MFFRLPKPYKIENFKVRHINKYDVELRWKKNTDSVSMLTITETDQHQKTSSYTIKVSEESHLIKRSSGSTYVFEIFSLGGGSGILPQILHYER